MLRRAACLLLPRPAAPHSATSTSASLLTPLTTWAYNWSGAHILRALEPEFDPQDPSAGDFFQAARLGHLPRVQWEVDRGDSRLDVGQLFGGTPLADAHDLQRFDRRGIAALHWAAIGGQLEVIELLLDEGVAMAVAAGLFRRASVGGQGVLPTTPIARSMHHGLRDRDDPGASGSDSPTGWVPPRGNTRHLLLIGSGPQSRTV